jgi:ribonuclease T
MRDKPETFISVDVETAGPIPGEYSLLSIGACSVFAPDKTFACELKPINRNFDPKALEVTGLSLDALTRTGLEPAQAMGAFASWLGDGGLSR